MKTHQAYLAAMFAALCSFSTAQAQRPSFDKSKDILIAQFDSKPDADDLHAIAALGCLLAHPDFNGVNYYAVAGAFGRQGGNYIPSPNLFNQAFGAKNQRWTDARNERQNSVTRIKNRAKTVLNNGGRVWVQEAGQSDITRDWIVALRNDGVSANAIKNRVWVIQHSQWNEDQTTPADLNYVRNNTSYRKIADGNGANNGTPQYLSTNNSFINRAKNSQNGKARALWNEADRIIKAINFNASYSVIPGGGVDFSDCVENWWIFQLGNRGNNVGSFWNRYVTNATGVGNGGGTGPLPIGAVVSLQGNNNLFVSSENGTKSMNCNRPAVGDWEKFTVVNAGGGQVALRGSNGRYVSSENGLEAITCNRTAIGGWEKFNVSTNNGQITLKGTNSRYISSENGGGAMTCNRSGVGGWERFRWQNR